MKIQLCLYIFSKLAIYQRNTFKVFYLLNIMFHYMISRYYQVLSLIIHIFLNVSRETFLSLWCFNKLQYYYILNKVMSVNKQNKSLRNIRVTAL